MDNVSPNVPDPPLTTFNITRRDNRKGVHCAVRARRNIMAQLFAERSGAALIGVGAHRSGTHDRPWDLSSKEQRIPEKTHVDGT
jgi:hypothetical protein